MQNEHNKLPYVFVEIDEIEDQDEIDAYDYDAEVISHRPEYPDPFYPRYPYMPPNASPYEMPPSRYPEPFGHSRDRDAWLRAEKRYRDSYARRYRDHKSSLYDDDEYDDYDDVIEYREADRSQAYLDVDSRASSDGDALNLETVVIPVFKNADNKKGANGPVIPNMPFSPVPLTPAMPFYQALPVAYNPFQTPFVNPLWALSRMAPPQGANPAIKQFPYPMGQPTPPRMQQNVPANPSRQPMRQNAPIRQPQMQRPIANNPSVPVPMPQKKSAGPNLPAEAMHAFAAKDSSAPNSVNNISGPNSKAPAKISKTVTIDPTKPSSSQQTITADTDAVSVSVKVLTPDSTDSTQQQSDNEDSSNAVAAAAPQQHVSVGAATVTPVNLQSSKKKSEGKPPKETFQEKAMRENAEKTHTSLSESNDVYQVGKPLLDTNAIETSEMFSTPTASMNDSMTGFLKSSRRKHLLMIIIVALILAAVIAAVVCVFAVWTGAATIVIDESNIPSIQLSDSLSV